MANSVPRIFIKCSAGLLLFTAAAKLYSGSGSAKILMVADPVAMLRHGGLMLLVGVLELLVLVCLVLGRSLRGKVWVIIWLSSNFMAYRFGNELLRVSLCPCLGTISDDLPLTHGQVNFLLMVSLMVSVLYLLLGSGWILLCDWSKRQAELAPHGPQVFPQRFDMKCGSFSATICTICRLDS